MRELLDDRRWGRCYRLALQLATKVALRLEWTAVDISVLRVRRYHRLGSASDFQNECMDHGPDEWRQT